MSLNIKTETGYDQIASSGGNIINGAEMVHYSTEERMIGYWTDGKPLYRKVIDFGSLPNTTTKTISANIPNLDKFTKIEGMRHRVSDNGSSLIPYIPFNINNLQLSVSLYTSSDDISIVTFSDRSNETATVIIEYTKITDTPITNNNTYSTDEVLTGETWIDGKPIYRKVIKISDALKIQSGTWFDIASDTVNIDKIISTDLSNSSTDKTIAFNFTFWYRYDSQSSVWKIFNPSSIPIDIGGNADTYFIVKYTKK